MVRKPIPMNIRHRDAYMRLAARITCPVARRRAMRSGAAGSRSCAGPGRTRGARAPPGSGAGARDCRPACGRPRTRWRRRCRRSRWRRCRTSPPAGHRVADVAAVVLLVGDRVGPAVLGVGARSARCRTTPRAGPTDPRRRSRGTPRGRRRVGRDDADGRLDVVARAAGVVAAETLLRRRTEVERGVVEVGVRAGRRVDDGMGAVDDLQLRVVPVGDLEALVLAVARPPAASGRAPPPRRRRRRRAGPSPSRPRACWCSR